MSLSPLFRLGNSKVWGGTGHSDLQKDRKERRDGVPLISAISLRLLISFLEVGQGRPDRSHWLEGTSWGDCINFTDPSAKRKYLLIEKQEKVLQDVLKGQPAPPSHSRSL